jgi:outer membrane protein OmpA-like peptidoglycan-associated protein
MKRELVTILTMAAFLAAHASIAQEIRDLTGSGVTRDTLIQVLTPKQPRPRGITLKPPECAHFRRRASRGIELAPKADVAALSVEFNTNSADLTPRAKKTLDALSQALDSAELKPCCFQIEGHTDSTGSTPYNDKLSEARAESVIRYLSEHGIEDNRMMPKGYGPSRPIAANATSEGRARNRRVQVVNLGYGTAEGE